MKKSANIEEQKKETLRMSIREGSGNAVMVGAGQSFITPYALALGAGNLTIGFLNSFVGLIGPLAQLKSSHLMEKYSRKKIVVATVFIHAILWIPIIILAAMFYFNIWKEYLSLLLIIFYSLHIGVGAIGGPAWFSWMGDLVDEKDRGKYFSKRNNITGVVMIIAMLAAGFILDFYKTKGLILAGFTIIFSVSMLARLYSNFLFTKHYDPKLKLSKGYYFSFNDFVRHGIKTNFGKFTLFVALINLAVAISAPFFTVYMLEDLKLNYFWFTLINISSVVFSLIFMPLWGKFADRYGNRLTLVLSTIFLPIVPILWLFSPSKYYLLIIPSFVGGVFWAGFNLASFNFIFDSTKPEHRALCSSYHNILLGFGVFFGSIIGGLIAKYAVVSFINIYFFIFIVSGVLRAVIGLVFLPMIKEVRETKKPPILIREFMNVHSLGTAINNFNHSLMHHSYMSRIIFSKIPKFIP